MRSESTTTRRRGASLLLLSLLVLTACSASAEIVDRPADTRATASSGSAVTEAIVEADRERSSVDVYDSIVDSVVYVEAPDQGSSGSGIVLDGGWILTNAHVVDRFGDVRIGRSDGEDLGLHGVHAVDWIFDLAVVGPVDDPSLQPMPRGESAALAIGSRILLVGFPDEDSSSPTPTLTEGIVSRRRLVALGDYPFLQVDATIAPGQSGGALINGRGELVGISGLEFGAGEFGLAFESDAMWPRVEDLLAADKKSLPNGESSFMLTDEIGPRRNFSFTIDVDSSGTIDLLAVTAADIFVDVQTLGGVTVNQFVAASDPFASNGIDVQLYIDEQIEGGENVAATVEPGTYQVVIGSFSEQATAVEVTASNPMRRFADVEEGRELPVGQIVEGEFDWSRDSDRWDLPLTAGQQVTIVADGISDIVLAVRLDGDIVTSSDDEGLGVFGTGARAEFVADADGVYTVEIGTFDTTRWGYLIEATVTG